MATKLAVVDDGFNLPPLNKEDGSEFGWFDRLLFGWRDGLVFDYSDWEARDLYEMMRKDYKATQLENVMSLPIISATRSTNPSKGDKGESEWLSNYWEHDHLNGGCKTSLDQIVDRMTSAIVYKKAYNEKVWTAGTGDFVGKTVYKDVAWRPQTTCRVMRSPKNGEFAGFEQEAYYVGPEITKGHWPIQIPKERAFVYIHGTRRDPLNGSSDMEVAYWCYKTKQKILFLWFQFLEAVSLPRTIVKANDIGTANQIAGQIAKLKSSGVLPVAVPGSPDAVGIDVLDVSGKGAEQFQAAITWLDAAATNSVLAGFLDLTGAATNGLRGSGSGGSYALSKDQSDYFLQSLEAKTREMEYSIRKDLFAPLIRYNFGPDAAVPIFKFEPLNDIDKSTSVELFKAITGAPALPPAIPAEFVSMLAEQVAEYIGMDGATVRKAFEVQATKARAMAAQSTPVGASPTGQVAAHMAGATSAATEAFQAGKAAKAGAAPDDAAVQKVKAMFEA